MLCLFFVLTVTKGITEILSHTIIYPGPTYTVEKNDCPKDIWRDGDHYRLHENSGYEGSSKLLCGPRCVYTTDGKEGFYCFSFANAPLDEKGRCCIQTTPTEQVDSKCRCGAPPAVRKRRRRKRLVHGESVSNLQYPWLFKIYPRDYWKVYIPFWVCHGSLINSRWGLSSMHCVRDLFMEGIYNFNHPDQPGLTKAYEVEDPNWLEAEIGDPGFGKVTLYYSNGTRQPSNSPLIKRIDIDRMVNYPGYQNCRNSAIDVHHKLMWGKDDIAETGCFWSGRELGLVRLSTAVDVTVYTPICLPSPGSNFEGREATVLGWGLITDAAAPWGTEKLDQVRYPELLQKAHYHVRSRAECRKLIIDAKSDAVKVQLVNNPGFDDSTVYCFGDEDSRVGTCPGDAGAPMLLEDNGRQVIIAIASASTIQGCNHTEGYNVGTKVSRYVDWIRETIEAYGGGQFCSE